VAAFRQAIAIRRKALGAQHPSVGITMSGLGRSLHALGQMREAERVFADGLVLLRKAWPNGHLGLAIHLQRHGLFWLDRGDFHRAEAMLREAVAMNLRVLPEGHPRQAEDAVALGRLLTRTRRFQEAEPLLLDGHRALYSKLGPQASEDARRRVARLRAL